MEPGRQLEACTTPAAAASEMGWRLAAAAVLALFMQHILVAVSGGEDGKEQGLG